MAVVVVAVVAVVAVVDVVDVVADDKLTKRPQPAINSCDG